ncbi:conserved crenarchaeal protein, putative [Candidatus Vecturithrix granuli]|uniref:Conserved crenarchaeal protein, putative n=1 Tax=Vecturithrix granuli TaxID=1499967 RepID=A0A0S6W9W6_VECG1|nr:conserved crenarchaeal protein, putative [Candidatus Vecturithrix granuli]
MAVTAMNTAELHDYLVETLPIILEENKDIQRAIFRISRRRFADTDETNLRFDRMFEELQQERELSEKRWEENHQRWQKNQEELAAMRRESDERWKESQQRWEENQQELTAMQRESNERWEKNQQELAAMRRESDERFERLMQEIKNVRIKHESSIGALGARWGIAAESSFRDGLKDLLEQDFGVQVLNITEYDDAGEVFGQPDQIELDLIIKNGTLIICEIKSSISRSEMYAFYRKVQFYEKRHQRKATKLMVISPMVDQRAKAVADKLGIIVHAYADEVELC